MGVWQHVGVNDSFTATCVFKGETKSSVEGRDKLNKYIILFFKWGFQKGLWEQQLKTF